MSHALTIVGAFLVLVGLGGIAAGAPDWLLGLSLGATLVQSGAIALVGGLVLIALSQVLRTLQQLLDRLNAPAPAYPARPAAPPREMLIAQPGSPAQPTRHSAVQETSPLDEPPDFHDEPRRPPREPLPTPVDDEPSRRRRGREFPGGEPAHARREAPGGASSDGQARVRREDPPPSDEDGVVRPRRDTHERYGDEPSRSRRGVPRDMPDEEPARPHDVKPPRPRRDSPPPLPPLPLPFDDRRRARETTGEPAETPAPRFRPVEPPQPEPAPAEASVVRSGVIGGMAYTLYSDGSIEAELPIGTVRFGSIAELQDHVTRTGAEAEVDFTGSSR